MAVLLAANTAAAVENARLHEESARLLEEVQRLHRTRERFFAMVNHELRNALAGVFGWAEMLVRKKDPATVPRAAFEVLDSAEQAIGADQRPARPEPAGRGPAQARDPRRRAAGRGPPRDRPGHPRGRAEADSPGADAPAELPSCETDASRVEQILVNLLGNAIQHTPEGEHGHSVSIAARAAGPVHGGRRRARDPRDASWSGSSTSTSPRRPARAGASDSACPSRAAWPGCSAASSAPCRGLAEGGRFVLELPATRIMKRSSRMVSESRSDAAELD